MLKDEVEKKSIKKKRLGLTCQTFDSSNEIEITS
jgi:hypothetical protein